MSLTPSSDQIVPDFEVFLDGSPLTSVTGGHVSRIIVDDSAEFPSFFDIELVGSDIPGLGHNSMEEDLPVALRQVIDVRLGYAGNLRTLIVGEISGVEPELTSNAVTSLRLQGLDRRSLLHLGHKTRSFIQQTDSDIAASIAQEAGLAADVEDSRIVREYVAQTNQTDLAFLFERASGINFEFLIRDETLVFRRNASETNPLPAISLGADLRLFRPRLTTIRQTSEITVRGWDVRRKEEITARAGGDGTSAIGGAETSAVMMAQVFDDIANVIVAEPVRDHTEAEALAAALLGRKSSGLIVGRGICRGRNDLCAGRKVAISGVGSRFGGDYYVSQARHSYAPKRGYQTEIMVRRNGW